LFVGGDCCEETCVDTSSYTCGINGYDCIDPDYSDDDYSDDDYSDDNSLLIILSVVIFVVVCSLCIYFVRRKKAKVQSSNQDELKPRQVLTTPRSGVVHVVQSQEQLQNNEVNMVPINSQSINQPQQDHFQTYAMSVQPITNESNQVQI